MAQGVYTLPNYGAGGGSGDSPRLGAISSNIGRDTTTSNIIAQIKKDAAANGLTQWGFSYLRQFGERIDPAWLKESSKEWFNKPPVNWMVPPKDEFLKIVEPAVRSSEGGFNAAVRDKGGFGGLWEKYHKEAGDFDEQVGKLPDFLRPGAQEKKTAEVNAGAEAGMREFYGDAINKYGIKDVLALGIQGDGSATNDPVAMARKWLAEIENGAPVPPKVLEAAGITNYTPGQPLANAGKSYTATPSAGGINLGGPNPNAAQDALDRAAREAAYTSDPAVLAGRERYSFNPTGMTPAQIRQADRQAQARFRQDHTGAGGQAPTGRPATPGPAAGGQTIDTGTYMNGVFVPSGSAPPPPQNFLPPYLQPITTTTGASPVIGGPGATPAPQIPGTSPVAPGLPQGQAMFPTPAAPLGAPAPVQFPAFSTGGGTGGFASTAAMLELPFYLRNLGGMGRPNRRMSYG